ATMTSRMCPALLGRRLGADDTDEAHACAGRPAEVLGERELPTLLGDGLEPPGLRRLAPQLQPALEEHPESTGANGVAEALEPAVGIHRKVAVEVERPAQHLFPRGAAIGEAEV